MKRLLLVAGILFISVVSTACINNLAVQELNTKAKAFIESGDYKSAVERLKSSIDLEPSAYESYYNLAVAYTKLNDYTNAFDNYKKSIELKNDFADGYYSLAICEENLILDLEEGEIALEDGVLVPAVAGKKKISDDEKVYISNLSSDVIFNYEKYLSLMPDADDKDDVNERLNELKQKVSQ